MSNLKLQRNYLINCQIKVFHFAFFNLKVQVANSLKFLVEILVVDNRHGNQSRT